MLTPEPSKSPRPAPGQGFYSPFSALNRGPERTDKNSILRDLSRDVVNSVVPFSLGSDGNLAHDNGRFRIISEQEYIAGLLFQEIAPILEVQVPSVRKSGIDKWEQPEGPSLYDAIQAQASGGPALDLREIARRDTPSPTIAGLLRALQAETPEQTLEVILATLCDATLPDWALERIRKSPNILDSYRSVFAEQLIGRGVQITKVTGPSRYLDVTDRPFLSQAMLLCGRACGGLSHLIKDFATRRKDREDTPPFNAIKASVGEVREGEVFRSAARFGVLLDELSRTERINSPEWQTAVKWFLHFISLHRDLGVAYRRIRSLDTSPENVELLNSIERINTSHLVQGNQAFGELVTSAITNPFSRELLLGAPEAQLRYQGPVTTAHDQQFALERIAALLKGDSGAEHPTGSAQKYSDYLRERLPAELFHYVRPPFITNSGRPVVVSFDSTWYAVDNEPLGTDTQEFLALPKGDEIGIFAVATIQGVPHVLAKHQHRVGALLRNAAEPVAGLKEEPQLLHSLPTCHLDDSFELHSCSAQFLRELGIEHAELAQPLLGTAVRQIRRTAGVLFTQLAVAPPPAKLEEPVESNDPLSFSVRRYWPLTQLISDYFNGNLHCTALFANALAYAAINNIPTALPFSLRPRDSTDLGMCLDLQGLRSTLAVAQIVLPFLPSHFKSIQQVGPAGKSLTAGTCVLNFKTVSGETIEKSAPVVSSPFHDSVEIICYSTTGNDCYMATVIEPNPMGQSRNNLPSTIHCEHGPRRLSGVGAAFDKQYSSLDDIKGYAARVVEQTLGVPPLELSYLGYDYPQADVSTERVYRFITAIDAGKRTIRSTNPLQTPFWVPAIHVLQSAMYGDVRDLGATIGAALLYLANTSRNRK